MTEPGVRKISTKKRLLIGLFGTLAVLSVMGLVGGLLLPQPSAAEQAALRSYVADLRPALTINLQVARRLTALPADGDPVEAMAVYEQAGKDYGRAARLLEKAGAPQRLRKAHRNISAIYDRCGEILSRDGAVLEEILSGDLSDAQIEERVAEVERLDRELAAIARDSRARGWAQALATEFDRLEMDPPAWLLTMVEQTLAAGSPSPAP